MSDRCLVRKKSIIKQEITDRKLFNDMMLVFSPLNFYVFFYFFKNVIQQSRSCILNFRVNKYKYSKLSTSISLLQSIINLAF